MKIADIRAQSDEQLQANCVEFRKEMYKMRNALSSKKEEIKPFQIQTKRRDIARCLTILRERELAGNL